MSSFSHKSLTLNNKRKLVYTAMSKHIFYNRMFISQFVLEKDYVPLNPFMIFDYFLLDSVPRDVIREANNTLVFLCDELWVFGNISDGVFAEIKIAQSLGKLIKYFEINKTLIKETSVDTVEFEDNLEQFRDEL